MGRLTDQQQAGLYWARKRRRGGVVANLFAPQNVKPPSIPTESFVGVEMVCDPGLWAASPAPYYTYQWVELGVGDVVGATTNRFTPAIGDVGKQFYCLVTGINSQGSNVAASNIAAATALPVGGDPYIGNVVYLAPFTDGTPGDTVYSDKINGDALAFVGTAQLSDAITGPFGEGLILSKPGNSRVRLGGASSHVAGWDGLFATDAQFCIEFFIYVPAEVGLTNTIFCWGDTNVSPDNVALLLNYNSTNNALNFAPTLADGTQPNVGHDLDTDGAQTGVAGFLGAWKHVHLSRTGDDAIVGVDGYNKVVTNHFASLDIENYVGNGGTLSPTIGASTYEGGGAVSDDLPFYMAHFRATIGASRYGVSATYSVPTGPFPEE